MKPRNNNKMWIHTVWRPAMAWMYFAVCIFDFIIYPILWSVLQAVQDGNVTSQWQPLTVIGGGLFHIAMGAVLGISAWSRGKEKMEGVAVIENQNNQENIEERETENVRR